MDHAAFALHWTVYGDQPRTENLWPELLKDFRPDDNVGDPSFVFQRGENHAGGCARTLTHEDKASDADTLAIGNAFQLFGANGAARCHFIAQQRRRMGFQ